MLTLLVLLIPSLAFWELLERRHLGLDPVQRWAGAMVLGPWAWVTVVWLQSLNSDRITTSAALALLLLTAPVALGSLPRLRAVRPNLTWALGAFSGVIFGRLAWCQFVFQEGRLYAGSRPLEADGAFHLTLIQRFVEAESHWGWHPLYAGRPLQYHHFSDLLSAALIRLTGESWLLSLALPCLWLSVAGVLLLFAYAREQLGNERVALLAVALVLFSGALNFSGPGPLGFFTDSAQQGYYFSNFVTGVLLPQRSTLLGWPLMLLALALVKAGDRTGLALAMGVAASLTLAHLPAWLTLLVLALGHGLTGGQDFKHWWLLALGCGLGLLPLLGSPPEGFSQSFYWQFGWLGPVREDALPLFWLKQFGGVLLLLVVGFATLPKKERRAQLVGYFPVGLLFVLPNLLNISPNPWDGCKILHFWLMLSAPLMAAAAIRVWKENSRVLCLLLVLSATLFGWLDLGRQLAYRPTRAIFATETDLELGEWVRRNTPPEALFAIDPLPRHPVTTLAGRRVLLGYPNWLVSHGHLSLETRRLVNQACLNGNPMALAQNRVDYVVLSGRSAEPSGLRLRARLGNYSVWATNSE